MRDHINLRINGLLAFETPNSEARESLIDEAQENQSFRDFMRQWLLTKDLKKNQILRVKIWLALTYADLSWIFDLSEKEITQMIRMARTAMLPPYRVSETEAYEQKEWSCFLVEQHLSPWIDGEIEDSTQMQKILGHLEKCDWCRKREIQYRELQGQILNERPHIQTISQDEWDLTIRKLQMQKKQKRIRIAMAFLFVGAICALMVGIFSDRTEKIPNVYEIPENL